MTHASFPYVETMESTLNLLKIPLGERHYINVSFECNRGYKFKKDFLFSVINHVFGESMCEISSSPMTWAHLVDRAPPVVCVHDTMITTSCKLSKQMVMDTIFL